jgi:hypothetical protein
LSFAEQYRFEGSAGCPFDFDFTSGYTSLLPYGFVDGALVLVF